jgi:4,5-dihydroxyphthalate decarboxylase
MPDGFPEKMPNVRRLFRDARAETHAYLKRTGIFPVTHVLVMKEGMAREHPRICQSLFDAFSRAQDECQSFWLSSSKNLSLSDAVFFIEEIRANYGLQSWSHGFRANRPAVAGFVRYAFDQGYTHRLLEPEELFPACMLGN